MYSEEKKVNNIALTVFSIVTVALVALRTIISGKYIEAGTGFYVGGKTLVLVFNILLIAFVVALIAYPFIKYRGQHFNVRPDGRAMGIASLVLAAGFIYDVYSSMTIFATSKACHHFISLFSSARTETTNIAVEIFQGYTLLISAFFALFSIIYFVIVGFSCLNMARDYSRRNVLALAPLWWSVFRAVYFILVPMRYSKISDMLYELIMIGFLLLFFSAFARVASRVDGESSVGKVIAYGACAAVFGAISSIPRLITRIVGGQGVVYTSPQEVDELIFKSDYCFMAFAVLVFCAGFVFYALNKISRGDAYLESVNEKIELYELELEEENVSQDETGYEE